MTDLREAALSKRIKNMTNMRFGRLSVLSFAGLSSAGHAEWTCKCDCGNEKVILGSSLRSGATVSCGCYFKDTASKSNLNHGMGRTKTAGIWRSMIARCHNPEATGYENYGARGIVVCDRWHEFLLFLEDMGECPDGFSIERIDNDLGYEPSNCKWIPRNRQVRNRRNSLKFDGIPLAQIAEETNMNYDTLYSRMKKYGTPFPKELETT